MKMKNKSSKRKPEKRHVVLKERDLSAIHGGKKATKVVSIMPIRPGGTTWLT
jgi:hypothetical protein